MRKGGRNGTGKDGGIDGRREPSVRPPRRPDLTASADDRALPERVRRVRERIDPAFGPALPAIDPDHPLSGRKDAGSRKAERRPRRRSLIGMLVYWCAILGLWGVIGAAGLVGYEASKLPPIDQLAIPKRPPNIAVLAATGTLLANRGDTGGAAVSLKDLPPYLPRAFIAIEDRRFYHHWGIDPVGIARAVLRDAVGGSVQGGSTLTQQLAKNLFLTQERTLSRKVQEAILALWLEHKYSKDQILELYLNRVYFGSGAYGVEAAARKYYGISAKTVTLAQAAVLAGLMKAPSKYAPNHNQQAATERAAQVIAAMQEENDITPAAAKQALAQPAQVAKPRDGGAGNYAADYVMDALDDVVGDVEDDIVVTTTIDPAMEAAGERALVEELDGKGGKFGVSQGALVAMDGTGGIKALIGGRNYADSQFDRAVAAKRQPGSAFKPFVYLAAVESGLTPDTTRDDAPINVKGWQPEDFSRQYLGSVTLTTALAQSLNTVAVRLGLEVGPKAVVRTAHRLGITSDLQPNASIALGTSEVSPLELVTAYVPFSNGGLGVQPHIITKVKRTDGKLLYQRKASGFGRVIDPAADGMMNTMMRETLLTGTAHKADLPGWQAAGKTGTSQDFRDAWFIGYTGALVTGVWLGNDDGTPTRKASGGSLPVDIWSRFMKVALQTTAPVPLPGLGQATPAPSIIASGKPAGGDPLLAAIGGLLHADPGPAKAAQARPVAPSVAVPAPSKSTERPETDALLPPEPVPGGRGGRIDPPSILDKLFGGG